MRYVDPTPFEPAMPQALRTLIADARRGTGPLDAWLNRQMPGWGQVGDTFGLLRGHPERLPHEVVGWCVGIAMFEDDLHALPDVIERERFHWACDPAIQAFTAGLLVGLKPIKRQWKSIEKLTLLSGRIPNAVLDVLAIGIVSDRSLERGVALRLAQKLGEPAIEALQAALDAGPGKKHTRRLTEAIDALAGVSDDSGPASDPAQLNRLLDAWRAHRDPELADAITHLGRTFPRPPITAASKTELEGAWRAVAAQSDPVDVHRLLACPWPGAWKDAKVRVEALGRFGPDPRVAAGLVDAASRYPSMGSSPLHRQICAVLIHAADPRQASAATRISEGRWANRTDYARVAESLGAVGVSAPPDAIRAEMARILADRDRIAQLWETVYADLDDAGARLVLADALQSIGDPRGEFIQLQQAVAEGTDTAAVRKRLKALLKQNIDAWSGPIPDVERASRHFERGFLTQFRCTPDSKSLEASVDLAAWRTVERLALFGGSARAIGAVLRRAPRLRELRMEAYTLGGLMEDGPFLGIEVVGPTRETAPEALRSAFPDLKTVILQGTPWSNRDLSSIHAEALAYVEVGCSVLIEPYIRSRVAYGLQQLGTPARSVTLATTGSQDARLDEPGWRVRVGPEGAALAWFGGPRWEIDEGYSLVRVLRDTGWSDVDVHVPGSKKKRAELAQEGSTLTFVDGAF